MKLFKLYFVLMHMSNTWASKCAITADRLNCTCEPERYPDGGDFLAKCLNENVILKYDNSRDYFEVRCQNAVSISDTLFDEFLTQDQTIESIKFEGCTLPETTFPKSFYNLILKRLSIICKGRTGSHPNWSAVMLQNLTYIEVILIQGCPTEMVPEGLFQFNPSLSKLYLEDNEIQSLPENLLYNITQLKTFSLVNNAIKDIPKTLFKFSGALENLNVKKNNLNSISLTGLKMLESLDLSLNSFTSIPENMFLDTSLLVTLNLGWNKLVHVTTRPFKSLVNLKTLLMSNNGPDISLPTGYLEGLVKLKNLYLSDCHMTSPPPDLLNWTRNLKKL